MEISRRGFLQALGIGTAAVVVPELVLEPRRRFWQVSRKAPVGFRPAGVYEDGIVWHVQPMPQNFSSLQMKLDAGVYGEPVFLADHGLTYDDGLPHGLLSGREIERLIRQQEAKLAEISGINDVARGVPSTLAGGMQLAMDLDTAAANFHNSLLTRYLPGPENAPESDV